MIMKKIATFILFIASFFLFASNANAAECTSTSTSSCTVSGAFSFSNATDGINGSITITTNGTLTLLNGYSVGATSFVFTGGTMVVNTGATLKPGTTTVYMLDADSDGYPASTTTKYFESAAGRRSVSDLTSLSTADCYDSNANAKPTQTLYYSSNRGDGSYDYNCDSATTKRRLSCTSPVCSACSVTCDYIDASGEGTACGTTGINAGYASATRNNDEYGNCVSCTGVGTTTTTMECR